MPMSLEKIAATSIAFTSISNAPKEFAISYLWQQPHDLDHLYLSHQSQLIYVSRKQPHLYHPNNGGIHLFRAGGAFIAQSQSFYSRV